MPSSYRLKLLLIGLAIAASLVIFDGPDSRAPLRGVVGATTRGAAQSERSVVRENTSTASNVLLALRPRTESADKTVAQADAFPAHDWTPPPPPPPPAPPPQPPAPPQPPPLPFAYLGKLIDGGKWTVFLGNQDRVYTVKVGETVDSNYKIEKIAPPLLTLTYLPLQQQQSLTIGTTE